jgi:hypothetical protein
MAAFNPRSPGYLEWAEAQLEESPSWDQKMREEKGGHRASASRVAAAYKALPSSVPKGDIAKINAHLGRQGLDGNGRFRRAEGGYVLALDLLQEHGIELWGVVSSHRFNPDANGFGIDLAYTNPDDPFSPVQIRNTVLRYQYTKLSEDRFEALAYLS